MRLFNLHRIEDESGVSGTGVVAQGVEFDNGWCAMTWLTPHTSVAFYTSIAEVEAIHGHNGKTKVVVSPSQNLYWICDHCKETNNPAVATCYNCGKHY